MKLTLESIQVIEAIARKGSFAAAATELFRVPSAITYAVQKLEEDLEVVLFDRSGHRAKLTPAGQALLDEGQHLLRAAIDLECRVKRVATGWESELKIAYDDILPIERLLPLIEDFYREESGTRLRFSVEVLGGCWDALVSGRADLVIAAPGDGPAVGNYTTRLLGHINWVFSVAPFHPLASISDPLSREQILNHRAVAVADSSRNLAPKTTGLLSGQDVLTVPTLRAKLAAQEAGLGIGYLPNHLIEDAVAAGRLVIKEVADDKPGVPFYAAWHTNQPGKALKWFTKHLSKLAISNQLIARTELSQRLSARKQ